MAQILPAIIAAAIANGITSVVLRAIVYAVVYYLSARALSSGVKPQSEPVDYSAGLRESRTMIRQPISYHRVIYGEARVSGPITFLHVTNENKFLHILLTIASHPIEEYQDIYIDEYIGTFDSQGFETGRFVGSTTTARFIITGTNGTVTYALVLDGATFSCTPAERGAPQNEKVKAMQVIYAKIIAQPYYLQENYTATLNDTDPQPYIEIITKDSEVPVTMTSSGTITIRGATVQATRIISDIPNVNVRVIVLTSLGIDEGDDANLLNYMVDNFPDKWTVNHRQSGMAKIFTRLSYDRDKFPAGIPTITASLMGKKVYDPRNGLTYWSNNPVTCLRDYLLNTNVGLGATSDEIDDVAANANANICDEQVAVVNESNTFTADGGTDAVTLTENIGRLRTGDGVTVSSAGTLPAGLSPATTYYWRRLTTTTGYLCSTLLNARMKIPINITGAGTGTHSLTRVSELRYTLDGSFESSDTPQDTIRNMLSTMSGILIYVGGKWTIYAGAYRTPTITFDESDFDGTPRITTRLSRRDLFNGVKGVFTDRASSWQPNEMPPVTNATYLAEDNDERIWRDLQLPLTLSPSMAQRLAKQELERVRQQISVELPLNLSGMSAQVGDVVNLDYARMGWSGKPFEVVGWKLTTRGDNKEIRMGVQMVLRETASTVFDWNSGEETVLDPAPNTNLPNPFADNPPTGLVATSELYYTSTSKGVQQRAILNWTAPADSSIVEYQYEYRESTQGDWNVAGRTTDRTFAYILDLETGNYDFRVVGINPLGVFSSYATIYNQAITGLEDPPARVVGFNLTALNDMAYLSWVRHVDLDVVIGGFFQIRHTPNTSSVAWDEGIDIGPQIPGSATHANLPLLDGTYMIKAVDSTGNQSTDLSSVTTTFATIQNMNVVTTSTQHTAFSGTKSNCEVVSSALEMIGLSEHALDFDREGGTRLLGSTITGFPAGDTISMEAWIHPRSWSTSQPEQTIIRIAGLVASAGRCLKVVNTGQLQFSGVVNDITTVGSYISLDTVYHVGVTVNGLAVRFFVNGQFVEQQTLGSPLGTLNGNIIVIGAFSVTQFFDGVIDEVRAYGRTITDDEMQEHYEGTFSDETGLCLWVPMDEGTGTIAGDISGEGNNLTLTSGTTGSMPGWTTPLFVKGYTQACYVFDNAIDLTEVYTSRLIATVNSTGFNASDLIDDRGLIDTWGLFDGEEVFDAACELWVRSTLSAPPAGYGTWQRFVLADYVARGFQFKLMFKTPSSNHDVRVSALSVSVDMPDRTEAAAAIVSNAGGDNITFTDGFKATPAIGITARNLASGDYWTVTNQARTGFTVRFFNSANTGISRTYDWMAKGYGREA